MVLSGILTIPGNAICVAKSVKLQDSKSITITENGNTTILPDLGYEGMSSVSVAVNVNTDLALSAEGTPMSTKKSTSVYTVTTDILTFQPIVVILNQDVPANGTSSSNEWNHKTITIILNKEGSIVFSIYGSSEKTNRSTGNRDLVTGSANSTGFSFDVPTSTGWGGYLGQRLYFAAYA